MLNVYIYHRWPTPSAFTSVAEYRWFDDALPQRHYFQILPLEVLLEILANCPVSAVVNLSSTCCSCRNFFMTPAVLNTILREAVLSPTGSMRLVSIHQYGHSYRLHLLGGFFRLGA